MSNAFVTDPVFISTPVMLNLSMTFAFASAADQKALYLDVYMASVFGFLQVKLYRLYYSAKNIHEATRLCLPMGIYRIAFLGYRDFRVKDAFLLVERVQITDTKCLFDGSETTSE